MRAAWSLRVALLTLVPALQMSCSVLEPQPDRTRFFVLRSLAEPVQGEEPSSSGMALGVGPVRIPDYLDRPQLVRRLQGNRVEIGEQTRWAEPLPSGFVRVLSQNLRDLLGAEIVRLYPWPLSEKLDYAVGVDVSRFEPEADGNVELSAVWSIRDGSSRQLLRTNEVTIKTPIASPGADGSVNALSEALADLSRNIAGAIQQLRTQRR